MPSKRTNAPSIASQLVLFFTAASALLLCFGLGVLYWIVVQHASEEDDEALADKLFAVRADIDATGRPQNLSPDPAAVRSGERVTYWVRVLEPTGAILEETPGMDSVLPAAVFPKAQTPATISAEGEPVLFRRDGRSFALLAAREDGGAHPYTLQVAQDRSVDDLFTQRFRLLVVALFVLGSLASAVIALTVTRRALRPLAEITHSLERTGPHRLDERVEPAAWPRELRPLAIAFDQMLDRLEDSFTRLSQFSADLAHELRTPIANLRGEAEVALTRPRSVEEYQEVIESSVAECERLSGIIDNLLFLARAEAAQGLAERTLFDGRTAIEKIVTYFGTIAEERHVAILSHGTGQIYADEILFGRALSNLVENALRFVPDGGRIEISLTATRTYVQIAVSDNGRGIEAKHLPRIFDRFYRADSSRSSQGSGLGLALVKSIMDLHGGSATVKSELQNGTVVTLSFPRQKA
jgi:two-component system heavy metal sensor histidine kinase CusS